MPVTLTIKNVPDELADRLRDRAGVCRVQGPHRSIEATAVRATVIDASTVAAVLFDEPEAAPVSASVSGRLIAPGLLRYEVAGTRTTKLIRNPARAREVHARYRSGTRR